MRFFNTRGPVRADDHYCIPPLERLDLGNVLRLIRQKHYFVLHAPRQTGKTTALLALRDLLNSGAEGQLRCVYATFQAAAEAENREQAMRAILDELADQARATLEDRFLESAWPEALQRAGPSGVLGKVLRRWAESDPTPLVLLIDEIDALTGGLLASALHQLRAGYPSRPESFPSSVALCGMRDMRDYPVGNSSPFNIAESMRLGDFTREETMALLGQHTAETGQAFEPEALEMVWEQTRGQPWLVNALAYDACFRNAPAGGGGGDGASEPVTARDIIDARESIIVRRETHIDHLAHRLTDERVRRVVTPILTGNGDGGGASGEDLQYARDLGLVATDDPVRLANPLYAEVVPRTLNHVAQGQLDVREAAWFMDPDGDLNVSKLLGEYQSFFRDHSEQWRGRFVVAEAWPQLLLQAHLQRVVNRKGRVEREYATGRGRTDLTIIWPMPTDGTGARRERRHVIECKIRRGDLSKAVTKAVEQTAHYMDACGAASGHVVMVDPADDKRWEDKLAHRIETAPSGESVEVWCM